MLVQVVGGRVSGVWVPAGVTSLPVCCGTCFGSSRGVAVAVLSGLCCSTAAAADGVYQRVVLVVSFQLVTVEEQQFLKDALYNTGILIVWDPAPYHAEIHEVRLRFL